jgi:DNA polymerase-4
MRKGYGARTIGIKLRFDDFQTATRELTLDAPIADADAIRRTAGECLKRVTLMRKIRLLGVRATNLCRDDARAAWAKEKGSLQEELRFSGDPNTDPWPLV